MNKITANLNYIAIALVVLGFALLQSFGKSNIWGLAALVVGIAAFGFYLFLNRERLKSRNSRFNFIFASNLAVIILLVVAIIAAVNFLATKIHTRVDVSEGKIHSLSAQSIQVTRGLRKELYVKAFISEQSANLYRFNSLIDLYRYHTDKIKVEVIDPYKNPSAVKRYEIRADGTLVLEYDKKDMRLEEISEETLTNAIIKVTRLEEKAVYFLQGHGEPDPDKNDEMGYSEVKASLEKLSYKVKKIVLFQENEIPADASALVLSGPQKPLLEKEIYLLDDYLTRRAGKLFLMLNPKEGAELKPLLRKLGVEPADDIVVELSPLQNLGGGDAFMPVVAKYGEHAITKNFNYATLFPLTRSLVQLTPAPKDTLVTVLASTSANSWGEANYDEEAKSKKITKDANDRTGPLDIAAAIEVGAGEKKARLVLFGDSDFSTNKYYYFQANGNLFANAVNWLAEEGDLIAIAPKTTAPRMLFLSRSAGRLIFFYSVIILPLFVLILGIGIWIYRRKL